MPAFTDIEVEAQVDGFTETIKASVDFEVFCARCGAGICDQADTRQSRRRKIPQITMEPCPACEASQQDKIDSLESELEELQSKE